ncbi:MAG: class I SAM-dependent methyltransferase, partial [Chloroflexi bacterium]|nr:class I SAM-dependent methyltransferase [Chloroflexota bacterium]
IHLILHSSRDKIPIMYTFTRYLAAKKSVDDRALNQHVWDVMARGMVKRPFHILEIGAGIGTMVERLSDHNLLHNVHYTAIDSHPDNINVARQCLQQISNNIHLELETIDLFDFIARESGKRSWDLLIAHAFLDLMDIPATLPKLFSLLSDGGHFYFTINFDGATILEPIIEPEFDAQVEAIYHRTMDERITDGVRSGDSRSGRHLFQYLRETGADILAAGSSDWVVFAGQDGYPADEAYFLHFIVDGMQQTLSQRSELDQNQLEEWITQRHNQIDKGELVYIAHQIDFYGRIK